MQFTAIALSSMLAASAVALPPRSRPGAPSATPSATSATSSASASASASPSGGVSTGPLPGLDAQQAKNAHAIMGEVKKENLGKQGCLAGIATALQESTLQVYANNAVPQSLSLPHDIVGGDQDSVGLFQQRPTGGYPDVAADMDPAQSAAQFFNNMKQVPGWQTMDVSNLCQTVQKAQAGNLYGQRVQQATQICAAGGFA